MTARARHKVTHRHSTRDERHPTKALQGVYGSGGSYGVGGGFADDEPGSKTAEPRNGAPDLDAVRDVAPDVHTRQSEVDDDALRELRRADLERRAAAAKRKRAVSAARKRSRP